MNPDADYDAWVKKRRDAPPANDLTDRIMTAIEQSGRALPPVTLAVNGPAPKSGGLLTQTGPILMWTAASLIFVARIAALVGNLVFPTNSYPEYAVDQRIEEVPHEHRSVSRS